MKSKLTTRRILALLLSLSLLLSSLSLFGCTLFEKESLLPKEKIEERMNKEEQEKHNYALYYFEDWGIPFSEKYEQKMITVQRLYNDYYYEKSDLPSTLELARSATEIFLSSYYDKVRPTDYKAICDALITSIVESIGDKYSHYRTASETVNYEQDMSGSFVGIGVTVTSDTDDGSILVTDVMSTGPAKEAGILPGDKIIAVGDSSVSEIGYTEALARIKGKEGTTVTISVLRGGSTLSFTITRRLVVEESVVYSIDENKIGYIRISSFKLNTAAQFRDAVDVMESAGVKAVIYDLRSNGGGYLSSVVNMLSYIAPKDTEIVSFSNNYDDPMYASSTHTYLIPSVVICNEYTASAGELFTAAIRDFGKMGLMKSTIVGRTTFGKGIMQNQVDFTDGASLTMTVAYYNPPSGVNYHELGITPDVIVSLTDSEDTQLSAAYQEINKLLK